MNFFSSDRSLSCSGLGADVMVVPFRRGFSADAGVLVEVVWGVRACPSEESTLRIATDFMASPFREGVLSKPF